MAIPNQLIRIFMSPTEAVLQIAPAIIRSYGLSFLLLPVLAGADSIWFAMPLTELLVAVYVVCMIIRYTKQLSYRKEGAL